MRLAKIVVALAAAASVSFIAAPAEAAGSLTAPCQYQPGVRTENTRTATFSSGWAVATDDTSPEILCSVQTTPQFGATPVAFTSSRGLACVLSTCHDQDYWACIYAQCYDGYGFICVLSRCEDGGSVCVLARCGTAVAGSGSRVTRTEPTAIEYAAPPGPLFSCTTVRWHRGDTVASESFHGCQPIQQ